MAKFVRLPILDHFSRVEDQLINTDYIIRVLPTDDGAKSIILVREPSHRDSDVSRLVVDIFFEELILLL